MEKFKSRIKEIIKETMGLGDFSLNLEARIIEAYEDTKKEEVKIINEKKCFEVFGKKYEDSKFIENYKNFCNDVSNIKDHEFFIRTLGCKNATLDITKDFSNSTVNDRSYFKIKNGCFISKDYKNEVFMINMQKLCDELKSSITFYKLPR